MSSEPESKAEAPKPPEPDAPPQPPEPPELDVGPYGLRGKDTPPLGSMFGGYAIIFILAVAIPLLAFLLIRLVIL